MCRLHMLNTFQFLEVVVVELIIHNTFQYFSIKKAFIFIKTNNLDIEDMKCIMGTSKANTLYDTLGIPTYKKDE